MSDEMKDFMKQLKEQVRPFVAMLFQESISNKIVVSGISLNERPHEMTPGPYWTVYNCIEHMTGVKTIPVTLGRFFPELEGEFMEALNAAGTVIMCKDRDKFTPSEVEVIYGAFIDLIKESFVEVEVTDSPGAYFDSCCKIFPGDVTTNMRKDFVAHQGKMAMQSEIAGAED